MSEGRDVLTEGRKVQRRGRAAHVKELSVQTQR